MDWMVSDWDDRLVEYIKSVTEPVDTVLLGRKIAEVFIPHWASVAEDPSHPEIWAGRKFTDTPKLVFSRTLKQAEWENTRVASDLVSTIKELKQQPGGDLIAYGGVDFLSSLMEHQLADELYLLVDPSIIGEGRTAFKGIPQQQDLQLIKSKAFDCGIVVLNYKRKEG